jgi:hypothetical protein
MRQYCLPLIVVLAVLLALVGFRPRHNGPPGWELKPLSPDATPVDSRTQLSGIYPAGSWIKDRDALGGFGECNNYPWNLAGQQWGSDGAVSLVAFLDEPVAYFNHRGFALRVVNRTDDTVALSACDSRLFLVREAQDASGAWREMEEPPQTMCGNSYHRVFLGPGQYWQFPAREYAGPTKTKMRFRLEPGGKEPVIYSNEFEGQMGVGQFVKPGTP